MIFPTFVVAVGALLAVCDAGAVDTLAQVKAVHAKATNGAGNNQSK
jgi:hypothetical protein